MDGVLLIDKPQGISSHDVVRRVRKILQQKKVGHAGTLDPMATGVLPILVGQATKASNYLMDHDKTYVATLRLGIQTDTGDREGNILEKEDVPSAIWQPQNIQTVLQSFLGEQMQKPPMYSAIKIHGKKLYEYARQHEKVEVPERKIRIYHIQLLSLHPENQEIVLEASVSKGTYMRTLCEDIARKLGNIGCMSALVRTQVNQFHLTDTISLDELEKNPSLAQEKIITLEMIFSHEKEILLNSQQQKLFLNGVLLAQKLPDGIYRIYTENHQFIGTGYVKNQQLKRDIIRKEIEKT